MREQLALAGFETKPSVQSTVTLGVPVHAIHTLPYKALTELDAISLCSPSERRGELFACWLDGLTPEETKAVEAWARRYFVALLRLEEP